MLRSILLKLSDSKGLAHWVTSNPTLRRMSHRFVAGETLDEAIAVARMCNQAGIAVTLDCLGENVATPADAQKARDTYLQIFDRIAEEKLNANVSCKLTQLGLDLSVEFCEAWCSPSPSAPQLTIVFCALIWKARCTPSALSNS